MHNVNGCWRVENQNKSGCAWFESLSACSALHRIEFFLVLGLPAEVFTDCLIPIRFNSDFTLPLEVLRKHALREQHDPCFGFLHHVFHTVPNRELGVFASGTLWTVKVNIQTDSWSSIHFSTLQHDVIQKTSKKHEDIRRAWDPADVKRDIEAKDSHRFSLDAVKMAALDKKKECYCMLTRQFSKTLERIQGIVETWILRVFAQPLSGSRGGMVWGAEGAKTDDSLTWIPRDPWSIDTLCMCLYIMCEAILYIYIYILYI